MILFAKDRNWRSCCAAVLLSPMVLLSGNALAVEKAQTEIALDCVQISFAKGFVDNLGFIADIPLPPFIFLKKSKANQALGSNKAKKAAVALVANIFEYEFEEDIGFQNICGLRSAKRLTAQLVVAGELHHFVSKKNKKHTQSHATTEKLDRYGDNRKQRRTAARQHDEAEPDEQLVNVILYFTLGDSKERYTLAQQEGKLEEAVAVIEKTARDAAELLTHAFEPFHRETLPVTLRRIGHEADGLLDQIQKILSAGLDGQLSDHEAAARSRVYFQILAEQNKTEAQERLTTHYAAVLQVLYGDLPRAVELFTLVEEGNSAASSFYTLVGDRYLNQKKWVAADTNFKRALKFSPENSLLLLKVLDARYENILSTNESKLEAFEAVEDAYDAYVRDAPCDAARHLQILRRAESAIGPETAAIKAAILYAACLEPKQFATLSVAAALDVGQFVVAQNNYDLAFEIFKNIGQEAALLTDSSYKERILAYTEYQTGLLYVETRWPSRSTKKAANSFLRALQRYVVLPTDTGRCPNPRPSVFEPQTAVYSLMNLIEAEAITGLVEQAKEHLGMLNALLSPERGQENCAHAADEIQQTGVADGLAFLGLLIDALDAKTEGTTDLSTYLQGYFDRTIDRSPIWNFELAKLELKSWVEKSCNTKTEECTRVTRALQLTNCMESLDAIALGLNLNKRDEPGLSNHFEARLPLTCKPLLRL
ncbi:MAG: hypothetical protein COB37_02205 [Kordiimonadales bacterium]|nr:MAG: hypothetical protein COB37_02205 [Kordiimonadales bacterium]